MGKHSRSLKYGLRAAVSKLGENPSNDSGVSGGLVLPRAEAGHFLIASNPACQ